MAAKLLLLLLAVLQGLTTALAAVLLLLLPPALLQEGPATTLGQRLGFWLGVGLGFCGRTSAGFAVVAGALWCCFSCSAVVLLRAGTKGLATVSLDLRFTAWDSSCCVGKGG